MRTLKTEKRLRVLNRETTWNRGGKSQESSELVSVKKTNDWSPDELEQIWRNTSG